MYTPCGYLDSNDSPFPPFNLFVRLPREIDEPEFEAIVTNFHAVLRAHHKKSALASKVVLPTAIELRGLRKGRNATDQLFARMNFLSTESSENICLGTHNHPQAHYDVRRIIRAKDGAEVPHHLFNILQHEFLQQWPGVSSFVVRMYFCSVYSSLS